MGDIYDFQKLSKQKVIPMAKKNKNVGVSEDRIFNIIKLAETMHNLVFGDLKNYDKLENLLKNIGIDVYYIEKFDSDGYLRLDKESNMPRIVVKAHQVKTRQRFTMAHELGHLLMHAGWNLGEDIKQDGVIVMHRNKKKQLTAEEVLLEDEADEFAGNFLMPISKIADLLKDKREKGTKMSTNEAVALIAQEFCVSIQAARVRLNRIRA